MVGSQQVADRFLANGLERGETSILLTTDTAAGPAAERVAAATRIDDVLTRLGVVDATGQPTAESGAYGVESAGSPADLTGIGIGVTRAMEALSVPNGRYRLGFDSLSTLLAYRSAEDVFKFCHVLASRFDELGCCSVLTLDTDAHEDRVVNTTTRAFDGNRRVERGRQSRPRPGLRAPAPRLRGGPRVDAHRPALTCRTLQPPKGPGTSPMCGGREHRTPRCTPSRCPGRT